MSTNFDRPPIVPGEWISQTEAARLRGVSRQAIAKLVRKGRFRTVEMGGHLFVNRADVESFAPRSAGRPKAGADDE